MTESEKKEFELRISQSNEGALVGITCEIAVNYIDSARVCLESGDIEGFRFNIKKSRAFIDNLSTSLDMDYEISGNLMSLYGFCRRTLLRNEIRKNAQDLEEVRSIIERIGAAFFAIAGSGMETEPGGEAAQQIISGYTYGKNSMVNDYVVGGQPRT